MRPAAEITRLQNSLQHLKQTQVTLQEYIDEEPSKDVDPEIRNALEENRTVMYAPIYQGQIIYQSIQFGLAAVLRKNEFSY